MRNLTFFLQQGALRHAKPMLFIRHRQPQTSKYDIRLQQCLSADHEIHLTVAQPLQQTVTRRSFDPSCQ